jgi:sialidase-1
LLAFCEGRKSSLADLGNNDLVMKRSTNGGKTWAPMQVIHDEGDETIGNPTAVVDRDSGVIWLVVSRNASDVLVTHSLDDGKTWSEPNDITPQVKRPEWKFYAVGPGVGIQLRHGAHKNRLVIPAYHRTTKDKSGPAIAHVFYSDDRGRSWQLGGEVGPHTCECQIVETTGHQGPEILLNARNHWARSGGRPDLAGKRIIARSRDGGRTWSEPALDDALVEPTCQASLLRYCWADDGGASRILFANPASRSRSRMTVRMSCDEGRTWPTSRLVDGSSSAYSSLTVLADGRIGLLYESGGYKRIKFAAFGLDWLTDERDL